MLESNAVSQLLVIMEASEPMESERSVNWNTLMVLLTKSGYSVKKWISRRRTATVCMTWGALHRSALALSLNAILKAGRAVSFREGC